MHIKIKEIQSIYFIGKMPLFLKMLLGYINKKIFIPVT